MVDALDECISKAEVVDLISLLGQALSNPEIPVIHILLTSRSEAHIYETIQEEGVHPLVYEIPVKTSGEGVAKIISLDDADVDNDIYIFWSSPSKSYEVVIQTSRSHLRMNLRDWRIERADVLSWRLRW